MKISCHLKMEFKTNEWTVRMSQKNISLQKHRTKWLNNELFSLRNTSIHTYTNPQPESGDRTITQSYNITATSNGIDL